VSTGCEYYPSVSGFGNCRWLKLVRVVNATNGGPRANRALLLANSN
jgi:hypothetical protein